MNKTAIYLLIALTTTACSREPVDAQNKPSELNVEFNGAQFLHRWSENNQHEFTPKSQEDLSAWEDMLTINVYPSITDGEGLAVMANQVLGSYQSTKAMVLKTDSVPRTKSKPAEHSMVVLFPRPEFIEAAFTRLIIIDGVGASIVYSHRIYGNKIGNEMSDWLKNNGSIIEELLMQLEIPFTL